MRTGKLVPILLLGAFVAAGATTIYLFWDRARSVDKTTVLICEKVDRLDNALVGIVAASARDPKPGEYGYDYWLHHPGERQNRGTGVGRAVAGLRKAACDPDNLTEANHGK